MSTIWHQCSGINHIKPITKTAWRIIEAQEITATRKLVDSLEEQILLEDMIDEIKPSIPEQFSHYHPLLYTPFRYPPLKHGSRFGTRFTPSLWYGSLTLKAAMAEKAFYQFHFLRASAATFDIIEVPLTAFSTQIKTKQGIELDKSPFTTYTKNISSRISYHDSQQLGMIMREAGIQAFTYLSARDPDGTSNIAAFSLQAFLHKAPIATSFQSWQSMMTHHHIDFIRSNAISRETVCFNINQFTVNESLPFPAN